MMRSSNLGKSEAGQVLVYVTIVLMLTMVIIPPLLGFVSGAGRTAQIREDRMLQVYAADAGIEDAYYRITGNSIGLPENPGEYIDLPYQYVNGCNVTVTVYKEAGDVYKIVSTATDYRGVGITIESWAAPWNYWGLFDNALSSYGNITLKPGAVVTGDVTLNGTLDNKGTITGNVTYGGVPGWPPAEELSAFYWEDVKYVTPYPSSSVTIMSHEYMGPFYRNGDLTIKSGNSSATLTLEGTVYVTGDLTIGQTNQDFTLYLNNQTIYTEQSVIFGGKTTLSGPGCIIAVGDVYFSPNMVGNDFIFILSVEGDLTAQPNGHFYGSMAGDIEIEYQPGATLYWTQPDTGALNFPPGSGDLPRIITYTIVD